MKIVSNPCLNCGACCAFYRVSFYWAEADDCEGGTVPVSMTEKLGPLRRMMKGTGGKEPRCIALAGDIGQNVLCLIYKNRPSVCREFAIAMSDAHSDTQCDKARAACLLPPLTSPEPSDSPDNFPKAA